MRVKVGINQKSLKSLLNKIDKLDKDIIVPIKKANTDSARDLIKTARKNLKLNGTDDTGGLRASLSILDYRLRGLFLDVGTDLSYSGAIEEGTTPHSISNSEFRDVMEWAGRKLRVPDNKRYRAAKNITTKIALEGTDAQPFLAPAATEVKDRHSKNIKDAIRNFNKKL